MSGHHKTDQNNSDPICTVDPYDYLKIVRNPDDTITRLSHFPSTPATPEPNSSQTLSKDVPLNPTRNTWIRLYIPSHLSALDSENSSASKRPLVIYFHGGGFVFVSASTTIIHDFCAKLAAQLDAVVASVEYRLAPEHRLPAAYDDGAEALRWVKSSGEAWLRDFADVSNCFLMGTSAGGNIAYHAGLRAAAGADRDELAPVRVRGLILHHPYFGGVRRTESEARLVDDPVLPLSTNDLMWELALPLGADRDHKYSNPRAGVDDWDAIGGLETRVLVIGCDGDPLFDRQVELAETLKKKGVEAVGEFKEGGRHGLESLDLDAATPMFDLIKDFIIKSCDN